MDGNGGNGSDSGTTTAKLKKRFKLFKGLDNIPFRLYENQDLPFIKEDDAERHRPVEVYDGHVRIFDLSDAAQLADYEKIIDAAAKGHVLISKEKLNWSRSKEAYIVFLRWLEVFLEKPQGGMSYEEAGATE